MDKRSFVPLMIAAALALAGCVDGATDDAVEAAAAEGTVPDGAMTTETAFAEDGALGPGGYVCPVVVCVGAEPMSTRTWDAPFDGTLVAVNLTLTWDATTPATEELVLGVGHGSDGGRKYDLVSGPSPLQLTLDGLNLTSSDDVRIFVWMDHPVPVAGVVTPQEFHLEGVLVGAP